jgi:arylsulfatase A-like enzyme
MKERMHLRKCRLKKLKKNILGEYEMSEKKQPNILLLFTDQQRYDTINACGYKHMITPNLDRLVNEGCHFKNAYTPNPVCVPARHHIITGLTAREHGYAQNYGHPVNHLLPTFPRILSDNGYDTRAIGKMHFRPSRRHNGFNKMELMEEIPKYREEDEYAMYLKEVGLGNVQNIHGVRNLLYSVPQRSLIPEEHHGSTWVGDRSVEYIKANAGRRPFFLWSSWIAPHPPFDVPDSFADLYNDADIPEPLQSETEINPHGQVSAKHGDFPAGKEKESLKRMRQLYYSAISLVDKNIGKILDALEETGELENTLIIFTSDHGEMLGDHGSYQKSQPYDSCSKIPFIIRYPKNFAPGSVREDFADLNDILPTVLDAAGLEYPGPYELPGGSLLNDDGKRRDVQYMETESGVTRWCSIRDDQYKFNYYYRGGREELFDMTSDPGETVNLLATEPDKYAETRNRMFETLYEYEHKWGLKNYAFNGGMVKFENEPARRGLRNGQFPVFPDNIIDEDEKASMNDFGDEIIQAVKDEPLIKLHQLDIEDWAKNGASPELIEKIKRETL